MPRKIIWEKWVDPFLEYVKEREQEDEEDFSYKDSFEKRASGKTSTGPLLFGPFGVIPLNESNVPSKVFNFWMAHTNFDVSPEVKDKIEAVPGVETLCVFSRYRFRIAIAKAFIPRKVLNRINRVLCRASKKEDKSKKKHIAPIDLLKGTLKKRYQYWAIFVLDNGEFDTFGSDNKEFVKEEIKKRAAKNVIASWEE